MSLIRSLRVFCLLIMILTVRSVPAIGDDWSKQVTASIQDARKLAGKGDLVGSRNAVFLAWSLYASTHQTPITATGELPVYEYLFPKGKAMCLFDLSLGSRLIYAEVRGDTFAVTWQAQLEQTNARTSGRNTRKGATQLPFVRAAGYKIVQELGHRPPADMPLVFFIWHPSVSLFSYGHINSTGVETSCQLFDFEPTRAVSDSLVAVSDADAPRMAENASLEHTRIPING